MYFFLIEAYMHVHVRTCMYIHVAAGEKWILFYVHFGLTNQISVPCLCRVKANLKPLHAIFKAPIFFITCNWSLFFYYIIIIIIFFFFIFYMKVIILITGLVTSLTTKSKLHPLTIVFSWYCLGGNFIS